MAAYLMETSKYFIGIMMILYVIFTYISIINRDQYCALYKGCHIVCTLLIFGVHGISFVTLYLEKNNIAYLFIGIVESIIIFTVLVLFQYIYPEIDRFVLDHMCLLMSIGFIIILRISSAKAIRQLEITIISLVVALLIPYLLHKLQALRYMKWIYAMTGIFSLLIVLILGAVTNGSKISYSILGFSFQPSEFVKIIFLFFSAAILSRIKTNWDIVFAIMIAGTHIIILVLSKDLGAALIFFIVFLFMLYLSTGNLFLFGGGILAGICSTIAGYQLFDHVRLRFQVWANPWNDLTGSGYQITQSLFSIGTGGWFGLGLTRGKPDSIPYVETDFIFSAIAEEMGVIFAIGILLVFLACFIRIILRAIRIQDKFYQLITAGLGIMMLFQVFLTVGGGTKLIPLTGVTLPMISYGGSSIITTIFMFGIIQGTCLMEESEEKQKKEKALSFWITLTIFVLSIVILCTYIIYFSYQDREQLVTNSYNPRQAIIEQQTKRGSILASGGEVLAETITNESGSETRVYPYDNLFSHIVGFDSNGKMGIEKIYNYKLITSDIALSQKVENAVEGVKNPGNTIQTSLNVQLQKTASEALGVYKGAVIVSEPSTGKILAMVSKPDFNPNEIGQIWENILEDKSSTVLLNRTLQGLYPPGSTFKIITALEYLIENKDDYQEYQYQCNGKFKTSDGSIQCFHGTSHGLVDFESSFAKSCNSSFANIGTKLTINAFQDTLKDLLFDQTLPTEFETAMSTTGLSEDFTSSDMVQLAIGQGKTLISPMHLSLITSAIANNGVLMRPYLVENISSQDGNIIEDTKPREYGRMIAKDEAAIMKSFMASVVEEGTATKLSGLSYQAAGKTGSAEYNGVKEDSHAWFTGFAPVDNPQVVITIIVEGAGSGGDYAVPIAKRIFDAYFEEYEMQ